MGICHAMEKNVSPRLSATYERGNLQKEGKKSKNKYFLFDKVCVRIEHAGNKRSIITSLRYQLGPSISNLVEQTIMFIHVHQT